MHLSIICGTFLTRLHTNLMLITPMNFLMIVQLKIRLTKQENNY